MTPVVWLKSRALCWDQEMLDRWLTGPQFSHGVDEIPGEGCVLIVPARYYSAAEVNDLIAPLPWVLIFLTSDEESTFDHAALTHPRMHVWVMTPRPGQHEGDRFLTEGCRSDTSEILSSRRDPDRPLDVFFAGQVTHQRRVDCVDAIQFLPEQVRTEILPTEGFLQGIDRHDFLAVMAATKIAPCPSGPATPDSFRLIEALEAGCLPIADATTPDPDYLPGYWPLVFGEAPPFPVVDDWADLAKEVEASLADWPRNAIRSQAWWLLHKRRSRNRILADIAELSGRETPSVSVDDRITVLVSTSPIASHPSTEILEQTIASVRDRLPDAEIIVMCDGVHSDQRHRTNDYEAYLQAVLWKCAHEWHNTTALVMDDHVHQANTTRAALELVETPLVLFVEHDTPLCERIPFPALADAIESGQADLVRFHHEAHVLAPHEHLMLDDQPVTVEGAPMLRTVQWSQRPHLASTGFYRTIIGSYFAHGSRTMIEDVMHGVVQTAWKEHGVAGWQQFRLWMYAPDGDMKRSLHLDGRGSDPKTEMVFAYPGPTPEGAPAP